MDGRWQCKAEMRGPTKSANPVLPSATEKQVWTVRSWQERAFPSAVSLQPPGPVVEGETVSKKDKLLLNMSLPMDTLSSGQSCESHLPVL